MGKGSFAFTKPNAPLTIEPTKKKSAVCFVSKTKETRLRLAHVQSRAETGLFLPKRS